MAAVKISKKEKKPTLNGEIIEEIFIQILCKSRFNEVNKNIEIFMLSGIQQFKIALNYFRRINEVYVYPHLMSLYINQTSINKTLYKCVLLKPILKVLGMSARKITISTLPNGDLGNIVFKLLVQEGIVIVHIRSDLTDEQFNHLCNVTSITNFYCPLKYSELSLLKSKSEDFGFITNLKELTPVENQTVLRWVKELCISVNFKISDLAKESLALLTSCISKTFPNAETLKLNFYCLNPSWKPVYAKMKEIEPNWFYGFSENINGEICIAATCEDVSSKTFDELITEDDEYKSTTDRIREVWDNGDGMIVIKCFNNVLCNEALIREQAIILAIELRNIANENIGVSRAEVENWSLEDKRALGIFCLYKFFQLYQIDRCVPYFETDIKNMEIWDAQEPDE